MKNSLLVFMLTVVCSLPNSTYGYFDSLQAMEKQTPKPILSAYSTPSATSKSIETLAKTPSPKNTPYILTEKEVREEIKRQLQEKYALDGELKIFLNKAFQDIPLRSDAWELEIIQCPPDKLTDKFLMTFAIMSPQGLLGQWQLPIRAELWKDAYISLRYIRRGENLYDRDFKTHPVDILRMRGRSVSTREDLSDYIAEQNVPQNDVLIYHDIKRKPDVTKGQIIDLIAEDQGIRIKTKVKAMQDGIKGESITVQNLQSKKNIQAQIVADNLVQVYF